MSVAMTEKSVPRFGADRERSSVKISALGTAAETVTALFYNRASSTVVIADSVENSGKTCLEHLRAESSA